MSSSSRSSRKRPRTEDLGSSGGGGLGGLYDFLPPPDPEKDAAAKAAAEMKKPRRTKLPPEDKTKVIFLDVDGVLLAQGSIDMVTLEGVTLPMREAKESDFSAAALGNLRSIVEETGATIVLSSEWRRREELQNNIGSVLRSHDVPQVSDITPIFTPKPELQKANAIWAWCERRAREIGQWLKGHPEVTAWVALDDLDFQMADDVRAAGTPWMKYRSVCTDPKKCLSSTDAAEAVEILRHPPPEPKLIAKRSYTDLTDEPSSLLVSTEDSGPDRIRLG
mmetsp:Transcript_89241/g.168128  ORF Transcript_89241/g.168128 Transcript_89241/m.168128 type:complete len:278 (-) Transcript_89241:107-940(-)